MPPPAQTIAALYQERAERFARAAARVAVVSARLSRARLALALVGVGTLVSALSRGALGNIALITVAACVVAFAVLVIRHERVERRRAAAEALARINRDARARLLRLWNELGDPWRAEGLDDHPYASDLDVFGHASLTQMLGPVRTPAGRAALTRWLLTLERARADEIARRQEAVRELAPLLDFRQQLTGLATDMPTTDVIAARTWRAAHPAERPTEADSETVAIDPEVGHFVVWAEGQSWLLARPWIAWLALVLSIATFALFIVWIGGWWPNALWLVTATAGWALRWWVHEHLEASYGGAAGEHGLRGLTALMALVQAMPFQAPELQAAQKALRADRDTHSTRSAVSSSSSRYPICGCRASSIHRSRRSRCGTSTCGGSWSAGGRRTVTTYAPGSARSDTSRRSRRWRRSRTTTPTGHSRGSRRSRSSTHAASGIRCSRMKCAS